MSKKKDNIKDPAEWDVSNEADFSDAGTPVEVAGAPVDINELAETKHTSVAEHSTVDPAVKFVANPDDAKSALKLIKVRETFKNKIGPKFYTWKSGKTYNVPYHVYEILENAGKLSPT